MLFNSFSSVADWIKRRKEKLEKIHPINNHLLSFNFLPYLRKKL